MKISIITATYNSALTVRDTIESVLRQSYKDVEYIIIDGDSTDNTLDIINEYKGKIAKVISESDKGIYDAMNKGIKIATGDIIGMLNSDDFFTSNNIIERVVNAFEKNKSLDMIYGDIHFVSSQNLSRPIRYYSSKVFYPALFRFGFMPAHPSCYIKKKCFEEYGLYSLDYKIAADYDLLIRYIYKAKINIKYLPIDFVTMRTGGASTKNLKSRYILNKEIVKACKRQNLYTNIFLVNLKYIYKFFELKLK